MGLETATFISGLDATNPSGTDPKSQGDDHLRLIKSTLKATFPNITGAVSATHTELNYAVGVTSAIQTQINTKGAIAGQAWTGTHTFPTQSVGDNSTKAATTAYVDTTFAPLASPHLTGVPTAPTAAPGTNTTQIATMAALQQQAFSAALPAQVAPSILFSNGTAASWAATLSGNSGKYLTNDGTTLSWATVNWSLIASVSPANGDTSVAFTGISTAWNDLLIVFEAVTTNSTGTLSFALGDATPAYGSAITINSSTVTNTGAILVPGCRSSYGMALVGVIDTVGGSSPAGAAATPSGAAWFVTGGVRAVRIAKSSLGFAGAGTIRIYGR